MSTGKLASQAGHAYLNSYLESLKMNSDINKEYQKDGLGTKICLGAENLGQLLITKRELEVANIPHSLIIDSGHIMLPFFDGNPIITALGIGPTYSSTITDKFNLVGEEYEYCR